MSDAPAIETLGLSKTYGNSVDALVDLDLRVERSEVFGYLGPNGAGKSTTLRLLLGLIHPTAGRASLFGLDTQRDGVASAQTGGLSAWRPSSGRPADRPGTARLAGTPPRQRRRAVPRGALQATRGRSRPSDPPVVERESAEDRDHAGVHARPEARRPRRADLRTRSTAPGERTSASARDGRGRADGVPVVPFPRRGATRRRPGGCAPVRPPRRRRRRRESEGALAATRDGDVHCAGRRGAPCRPGRFPRDRSGRSNGQSFCA